MNEFALAIIVILAVILICIAVYRHAYIEGWFAGARHRMEALGHVPPRSMPRPPPPPKPAAWPEGDPK